jgi:hypothetical protein
MGHGRPYIHRLNNKSRAAALVIAALVIKEIFFNKTWLIDESIITQASQIQTEKKGANIPSPNDPQVHVFNKFAEEALLKQEQPFSANKKNISNPPMTHSGMNAVIHIGPHKTGTTTIQRYSARLIDKLAQDGYEMPFSHFNAILDRQQNDKDHNDSSYSPPRAISNQVHIATCFLGDTYNNNPSRMNVFSLKIRKTKDVFKCRKDLLQSSHEIAQANNSILISAETFDHLNTEGIAALNDFVSPLWKNVTIVVAYRRYYNWITSYYNQASKGNGWKVFRQNATDTLRPSIYDALTNSTWVEIITSRYTLFLIQDFKRYFNNVVTVNLHDESAEFELVEYFYCSVIPHAPHTCEAVKKEKEQQSEEHRKTKSRKNKSVPLFYQDMAYAAHRSGMIDVRTKDEYAMVANAIQDHATSLVPAVLGVEDHSQQQYLHPLKMRCPPKHILDRLWDISLRAEREILHHREDNPHGEPESERQLKVDFEKQSKTSLCEVDMLATLDSSVWKDFFFHSLQQRLQRQRRQ